MIESLPHVNATLNAIAGVLLMIGVVMIRRGREARHKQLMLSAFAVSTVFLICYIIYHANAGSKKFPREDYASLFSAIYYVILATHVVLAAAVPFLAMITIYLGWRGYGDGSRQPGDSGLLAFRRKHRKWARWTFPIWMYVSITGVGVYFMLYHWFPPIAH